MSDSLLDYKITGWATQFKPDIWADLSPEERLGLLREAENRVAEEENRRPREIVPIPLPDNKYGVYSPNDPENIYINEKLVQTLYLDDFYDTGDIVPGYTASIALETVFHEGRHAYQDDCVKGKPAYIDGIKSEKRLVDIAKKEGKLDDETLKLWRMQDWAYFDSTKKDPHLTLLDKYLQYYFQPTEDDAEAFAMRKLQEIAEKVNDDHFSMCCMIQAIIREEKEKNARELWQDPDFRKIIAQDVVYKYAQVMEEKASRQESEPKGKAVSPLTLPVPKGKPNLIRYALFGGILLYLLIMYLIASPSGLVSHLLWFLAAMIPFLPVILLLRFFPKLHNKKGGILLAAIFSIFLLLMQLFYSWLSLLFLVGTAWVLLKGLGSAAPNLLTITRENADGTTTTETRIVGDDMAAEIAGAKAQLRSEGYTDIREG